MLSFLPTAEGIDILSATKGQNANFELNSKD